MKKNHLFFRHKLYCYSIRCVLTTTEKYTSRKDLMKQLQECTILITEILKKKISTTPETL